MQVPSAPDIASNAEVLDRSMVLAIVFLIDVGVRASLRAFRLISRTLKLKTMQASSSFEICKTRTGDL